jgi:hypothetical protein
MLQMRLSIRKGRQKQGKQRESNDNDEGPDFHCSIQVKDFIKMDLIATGIQKGADHIE